jgi:hypothetical protein
MSILEEANAEPPAGVPGKRGPRRPLDEQRNPRVRITKKSAELLQGMSKGDSTDAEIIESALVACYLAGTLSEGTPQTLPGVLDGLRESHRAEAMSQAECLRQARMMMLFAKNLVIIEPLRENILKERDNKKAIMDNLPPNARPLFLRGGPPKGAIPSAAPAPAPAPQKNDVQQPGTPGLEAELGGIAPMVAMKLKAMAAAFGIPVDELRLLLLHVAIEEFLRLDVPPERVKNAESFYAVWRTKAKREMAILGEAERVVEKSAKIQADSERALQELTRAARALGARLDNLLGHI